MRKPHSRRQIYVVRSAAVVALGMTAATLRSIAPAFGATHGSRGAPSPIKLGLASYTFRNFSRAQMITWMKQLNLTGLNAKDTKDHLPMDPTAEHRPCRTTRPTASICTPPAPFISRRTMTTTSAPSSSTASAPVSR